LLRITLLSFLLISCSSPTNEDLIVGKWEFADFQTGKANFSPEEELQLSMAKVLFKNVSMTYFKDKTYESKMNVGNEKHQTNGTYRIEGDGKYLVTDGVNQDGKSKNERVEIMRLTKDSLIIGAGEGGILILTKAAEIE
jgi:hypothetical protein